MIDINFINENFKFRFDKKFFLFSLGSLLFLSTYSQGFEVNSASVEIYISENGYFDVVENYDLTFTTSKDGIYRDIQTNYDLLTEEGKQEKRRIKIRNVEVPGHKFTSPFDFVQSRSDNFEIKIGKKSKTLIGPQHYEIKYRVYNAFLFEKEQIRFYWNIKPDGWHTSFQGLDFTVHIPQNTAVGLDDFFVYSGETGVTHVSEEFDITYKNEIFTAKSRPEFVSHSGQSVTALLNLPLNSVKEIKPFWPFWTNYGWTLILAVLLVIFYFVWRKYANTKVVVTTSYFPPDAMDPAMAGFLIDNSADTPDLISLLPHWGVQGIIKMEQLSLEDRVGKGDAKITRLLPLPADASQYEQTIYRGLFGPGSSTSTKEVKFSDLKNKFYYRMNIAKKQLKYEARIYYDAEAKKIKTRVIKLVSVVGVMLFAIFLIVWGIWAAFGVIPIGIFLLVITIYTEKKNTKGLEAFSELKGFKKFIEIAEEKQLKMLLVSSPNYFESTMAYALAFGLFDEWVKKFDALNSQPPSFYTSSGGNLTMHNFSNSFSASMAFASTMMVSSLSSVKSPDSSTSRGSSGGGSSGDGFGGGGGGSW